ncbi:MAG: cupin domain-containing protein [Polyangiaceae bacterium]|nr:cupin domain-containing protein [Polyangiaceae bacterium]
MSNITVKSLRAVEPYSGQNAIEGIRFRAVRSALGVSSWGMNVLELDPKCEGYPEHDHEKDGQEEVYVVLEGSAVLIAEGSERKVSAGDMIRVPPDVKRKFVTRDEGVVLLALGGTPGKAYQSS